MQPVLRRHADTDPLLLADVPALARETYRRGLEVLVDALDLVRASSAPGRDELEQGIDHVEQEMAAGKADETESAWVLLNEDRLTSYRERLALLDHLDLQTGQLLHQAARCETSLHRHPCRAGIDRGQWHGNQRGCRG